MIGGFLKLLGLVGSIFLIGSSNYVFNIVVLGQAMDVPSGIILYLAAGITYFFGVLILAIIYLFSAGRRDISLGVTLVFAGVIHYYPVVNVILTDINILFIWALQFMFSIFMSILFIYLGYRKLRKRLVELTLSNYIEL
ncbi:TPA: hypothetical protein EYP83_04405 [Candidatus Geothermarchaeota archaeon]|nr:hypothetical protein [Candidatus Geothermarchaeota archaeon]